MRGRLAGLALLSAMAGACGTPAAMATPAPATPAQITWKATAAPSGDSADGVQWIAISGAGGRAQHVQLAAVARPSGGGPFPVLVALHGSGGLDWGFVKWASTLARSGFLVVTGCWNAAGPIGCPKTYETRPRTGAALVAAAASLPGADSSRLGVFGFSAGGFITFAMLAQRADIKAAVVDSSLAEGDIATVRSPVLMLVGDIDAVVKPAEQLDTAQRLLAAGKPVTVTEYPGVGHGVVFDPGVGAQATQLTIDFFRKQLG